VNVVGFDEADTSFDTRCGRAMSGQGNDLGVQALNTWDSLVTGRYK